MVPNSSVHQSKHCPDHLSHKPERLSVCHLLTTNMKITDKQRLSLIENIIPLFLELEPGGTERERDLQSILSRIYEIAHPAGKCKNPHADWEKETAELIKIYEKL